MRFLKILMILIVGVLAGILVNEFWLAKIFAPTTESTVPAVAAVVPSDEYLPGSETLGEREIRITAVGTGFPFARQAQAAASWLVELGNGDVFLFDIGTGAAGNLNGLGVELNGISALFLSHLHVDHVGDLDQFIVSRFTIGALEPVRIVGPSGHEPHLGTRHFVETLLNAYVWDFTSRAPIFPTAGREADIHEFDYAQAAVVYDRNGVKVTAFPAVHAIDGAVSYRLEWNGRVLIYSGDTTQNKWLVEHGRDADVYILETFLPPFGPEDLPEDTAFDPKSMLRAAMFIHSTAPASGKIFGLTRPRLAVGYHILDNPELLQRVESLVRSTYDGPLLLAQDRMVINVTDDDIRIRKAVFNDRPLPSPPDLGEGAQSAPRDPPGHFSDWLARGRIDYGTLGMPNPGGVKGLAIKAAMTALMQQFPDGVDPDDLEQELARDQSTIDE